MKNKKANILIPKPPSIHGRIEELDLIDYQYKNKFNPPELQNILDKNISYLFNQFLLYRGYSDSFKEIKNLVKSIKPIIKFHKKHFNQLRPLELSNIINKPFSSDSLETAESPSYPSGHTTQAYYVAHILSKKYPELAEDFYKIANMVAESRIDRGVHFPSDNVGGKILATKLASYIDR
jgi:hypothetical protein